MSLCELKRKLLIVFNHSSMWNTYKYVFLTYTSFFFPNILSRFVPTDSIYAIIRAKRIHVGMLQDIRSFPSASVIVYLTRRVAPNRWNAKHVNDGRLSGAKFQRRSRDETASVFSRNARVPVPLCPRIPEAAPFSFVSGLHSAPADPFPPWNKLVINFCELLGSRRAATGIRATGALSFPVLAAFLSAIAMDSKPYFAFSFVHPTRTSLFEE